LIIDLERTDLKTDLDAQVCVVGGGAVGLVLATVLAEHGVDVLVLEGGGTGLEDRSQALQAGESVGHPFESIGIGRYRVLGGTTIWWSGQVMPFDEFVTGARPWLGHSAWPVEPAMLQQYFLEAYRRLGLEQVELDDANVWRTLGARIPELGPGLDMVMTRWLKTTDLYFARLFDRALRSRQRLRVLVHANAVSLELSAEHNTVHAVHARSLSGPRVAVRARQFVLANGALETVRLLKHPLANGSFGPWAASKWLGTPLIDHLTCVPGEVTVLDHERFHHVFSDIHLGGYRYYPQVRLGPGVQRSEGLVDIAAAFVGTPFTEYLEYLKMRSLREMRGQTSWRELLRRAAAMLPTTGRRVLRYFRDRRSFKPIDTEVHLEFHCEQLPCSRSRVELSNEIDALGMRRLRVDWQIDGRELKSMRFFGNRLKQELEARGLASITLDPRLEDEDPAFLAAIHDWIHHMGTARIGRNPDDGFVDKDLKVFGIRNLYLSGAAVFPSTGFANPTFTAIALALRLRDHLVQITHG
jgi:choline dehydrogenase-like flavoprotein